MPRVQTMTHLNRSETSCELLRTHKTTAALPGTAEAGSRRVQGTAEARSLFLMQTKLGALPWPNLQDGRSTLPVLCSCNNTAGCRAAPPLVAHPANGPDVTVNAIWPGHVRPAETKQCASHVRDIRIVLHSRKDQCRPNNVKLSTR